MRYLSSINSDLLHSLIWCNLIAIALGLSVIMLLNFLNSKKQKLKLPFSGPVFILVLCYVISVAAITIIPVPYTEHFKTSRINLVPIATTYENLVDPIKRQSRLLAADVAMNIIGNILMFMPLGLIIPALIKEINTYWKMTAVAILFSMMIEITQLFSRLIGNYRQVDIDDVILNTLGAVAGYFIYRNFIERRNRPAPESSQFIS